MLNITGYSERGVINSFFYELKYFDTDEKNPPEFARRIYLDDKLSFCRIKKYQDEYYDRS